MQIIDISGQLPRHTTKRWERRTAPIDCFCVHHSATRADISVEAIARYHVETKGMAGIQYHYVITADGAIYQTEPDSAFVWHGNDWNTGLGVCLLGDFTEAHPTAEQIAAARWLLTEKRREYGTIRLVGHGEAPRAQTECPGQTWGEWKGELEATMSKLGPHYQGTPELKAESTEVIRDSRVTWVKGIDADRWSLPAKDIFPGKKIICRFWIGGDKTEHAYMARGAAGADEYVAMLMPRYRAALEEGALYWEGPNEPHPTADGNDPAAYEAFELRWAQRVVELGAYPLVWSVGNGWFTRGTAHLFTGSIAYASAHGGGLAKHEYGAPSVLSGNGWWTYGTLHILDELYAAGLPKGSVRVFITECGISWLLLGGKDVGWKGNSSWVYPEGEDGLPQGGMSEERYWRQISAYDDGYASVPEVVCVLPFTTCPNNDWKTHDFGGSLLRRMAAKHDAAPVTDADIEAMLGEIGQRYIVPLNPAASLYKAAVAANAGAVAVSPEVRVDGHVFQAFRFPGQPEVQHWFRCKEGDWGNVKWFTRQN